MSEHLCERLRESMSAFVDGELPSAEAVELARHVSECAACERYLATLRETVDACRSAPRPCLGEDCLQRAISAAKAELLKRNLIRS